MLFSKPELTAWLAIDNRLCRALRVGGVKAVVIKESLGRSRQTNPDTEAQAGKRLMKPGSGGRKIFEREVKTLAKGQEGFLKIVESV